MAGMLAAITVPVIPLLASGSVGAQDSSDLAAQVDRIQARRAELDDKLSILDEEANQAKLKLADLEKRVAANGPELRAAVAAARQATEGLVVWLETQTPPKTGPSGIDQVRAARSDLATKQSYLDDTSEEIAAQKAKADKAREETKQTESTLAKEEQQVKGALKEALEREEAARQAAARAEAERRQAEAEAKAKAEAAAHAEASAAAAVQRQAVRAADSGGSSGPSGGSSGATGGSSSAAAPSSGGSSGRSSAARARPGRRRPLCSGAPAEPPVRRWKCRRSGPLHARHALPLGRRKSRWLRLFRARRLGLPTGRPWWPAPLLGSAGRHGSAHQRR